MADLSGGPAGGLTGYMTMLGAMSDVANRNARLGQFLQDEPIQRAQAQAQLQAQQYQNQMAPTMMQAQLQGSPFEQQKFQQQQYQQDLARRMQELQFNRQQQLAEETLRHNRAQDERAMASELLKQRQPVWDPDSKTWNFPPSGSRLAGPGTSAQVGQPATVDQSGNPVTQPILSHKKAEMAMQLSEKMLKQMEPAIGLESDINQVRALLKEGGSLAHRKINEKLISILDPNRTSSQLLAGNRQFGDLIQRTVGHVGQFFTGEYTDAQQKEIQNLVDEMEARAVKPVKQNIKGFYEDQAKMYQIPSNALKVPNFYGQEETKGGWNADKEKRYQELLRKQSGAQ